MKLDFSKFTGAASGSMTTAKAVMVFDRFAVTFQFNPAALRISAYGGGMAPITSFSSKEGDRDGVEEKNGCGTVDYGPVNETVTVRFQVVFDAVVNTKAFRTDMVNPAPTNLIRQGVHLAKGEAYTVRPIVEGFLAAVRNCSTRRVIFQWGGQKTGGMEYGGYLNSVQCRYTMFDPAGEAVRAQVDLSLVCSDHKDNDNAEKWRKRFDAFIKGSDSVFKLPKSGSESLVSSLTGNIEKAYILFRSKIESEGGERGTVKGKAILEDKVYQELSDMAAKIANAADRVTGKEPDIPKLGRMADSAGYTPVRIQYNPSSISMHSRGGEMMMRGGGFGGTADIGLFQKNAIPTETVLSMDLIFDSTVNSNAFMLDAGIGSPTGLAKAGMNLKEKMEGRECSVAPVSELFVAAIASADSRLVCVVWNKMAFWGELCEAEVEYTMFNNKGNPVRSKVSIRVRQDGESAKDGASEKNWEKAYKNLPNEAAKLVSSKSLTNSSGNVIASNLFRM